MVPSIDSYSDGIIQQLSQRAFALVDLVEHGVDPRHGRFDFLVQFVAVQQLADVAFAAIDTGQNLAQIGNGLERFVIDRRILHELPNRAVALLNIIHQAIDFGHRCAHIAVQRPIVVQQLADRILIRIDHGIQCLYQLIRFDGRAGQLFRDGVVHQQHADGALAGLDLVHNYARLGHDALQRGQRGVALLHEIVDGGQVLAGHLASLGDHLRALPLFDVNVLRAQQITRRDYGQRIGGDRVEVFILNLHRDFDDFARLAGSRQPHMRDLADGDAVQRHLRGNGDGRRIVEVRIDVRRALEKGVRSGQQENQDSEEGQRERRHHSNAQLRPFCFARNRHRLVFHELAHVDILRCSQFRLRSFEYQASFVHDEKFRFQRSVSHRRRFDLTTVRIVAKIRHQMPVLIAMRHHDRGSVPRVALFNQQVNDRLAVIGSRPAVGES